MKLANAISKRRTRAVDVLPTLLIEVRDLRGAMEEMAAAGPRVQLALGRVQLQEQRINTLIRRLDEAHGAVAVAQASSADLKRRIVGVEDSMWKRICRSPAAVRIR